jgi:hypothetical protein
MRRLVTASKCAWVRRIPDNHPSKPNKIHQLTYCLAIHRIANLGREKRPEDALKVARRFNAG